MLTLKNISKTFHPGTVNEKKALERVNLELADGDFATIVGSNGAGKSTLFNAITGAFYVDAGQIIPFYGKPGSLMGADGNQRCVIPLGEKLPGTVRRHSCFQCKTCL